MREMSDPRITEYKVDQAIRTIEGLLPLLRNVLEEVKLNKDAQWAMRKTIKDKIYEKKMD